MTMLIAWRSTVPGANCSVKVTVPLLTSTVPCTRSGGRATPAVAATSPTGSVTSAWKMDGTPVGLVVLLLPHAAVTRMTVAALMANRITGVVMFRTARAAPCYRSTLLASNTSAHSISSRALLSALPRAEQPRPVQIINAPVDLTSGLVTVIGSDFRAVAPTAYLRRYALTLSSFGTTSIVAGPPAPVAANAGSYLLTVTRFDKGEPDVDGAVRRGRWRERRKRADRRDRSNRPSGRDGSAG